MDSAMICPAHNGGNNRWTRWARETGIEGLTRLVEALEHRTDYTFLSPFFAWLESHPPPDMPVWLVPVPQGERS